MSSLTLGHSESDSDSSELEFGDGKTGLGLSSQGREAWAQLLRRFHFAYTGLILAGIVTLVTALNLFAPINGWIYDVLSSHALLAATGEPEVIQLEVEQADFAALQEDEWIKLFDLLIDLGAQQVIFTQVPDRAQTAFHAHVAATGKGILGRRVYEDPVSGDSVLEPWPLTAIQDQVGASAIAAAQGGVHRMQATRFNTRQGDSPAVEIVAARNRNIETPEEGFRVNFLRGPDYIPLMTGEQLRSNSLIPSAVQGRVVVVGARAGGLNQGLHTPLYQRIGTMSLAQFQAFSLDTILRNAYISTPSLFMAFLLFFAILVVSVAVYSLADFSMALRATGVAIVAYLLIACLVLWRLEIWLPVTELAFAQGLALLAVYGRRRLSQDLALRDLHTHMATRVRQRLAPAGFFREPELGREIIGLVDLTLNLRQFAVFRRNPSSNRLQLITAQNCEPGDLESHGKFIASTLLEARNEGVGPYHVSQPLIGQVIADGTEQMIVPLVYAGEELGAWLVAVDIEERKQVPRFDDAITVLGETIAELMMHRLNASGSGDGSVDALSRLYDADKRGEVAGNLSQIFGLMERRLILLESVDRTMDSPVVVFDNFGTVIEANPEMEHWARLAGIKLFDMNALQFVSTLTGQDVENSREHLRAILVDRRRVRFLVPRPDDAESLYDVYARPLARLAREGGGATNFETEGMVFELHAVGHLIERYRRREEFIAHMIQQVVNSAERVAAEAGEGSGDSEDSFTGQEDLLDGATKLRELLSEDVLVGELASFPVDPQFALRQAVRDLRERLDQKSLDIDFQFPTSYALVIANPDTLRDVYEGMVKVLIDDAAEGTRITATMEQSQTELGDWTAVQLRSMGFGLPRERLKAYLATPSHRDDSPLAALNRHATTVDQWGGRIEGDSTLGEGVFLTLRLRTFIPQALPSEDLENDESDDDEPDDK